MGVSFAEVRALALAMPVQLSTVDAEELRELVVEAWRQTAPKKLVNSYDGQVG
jgi:hypothetical protein